ncbi:MAG: hypothetical protein ACYC5N_07405 [Endomicrobiales bacterium]
MLKAIPLFPIRMVFSFAASHGERLLAVLIILCFLVNGFVPRFSIEGKNYEALSQLIARQSALLQLFSFSSLPVKIVNELFVERCEASRGAAKKLPKDENRNNSNSSTDYSLSGLDSKTNGGRYGYFVRNFEGPGNAAAHASLAVKDGPVTARAPGAQTGVRCLLVLMFFFLLPRSSVSEDNVLVFSRSVKTQLAGASWVFYL